MGKIKEESVCAELRKHITENIVDKTVEVGTDQPLRDLGFDSVAIIDLILFIERRFGAAIDDKDLIPDNLYSIHTLAKCALKYID
jgi:acyl carrier protein